MSPGPRNRFHLRVLKLEMRSFQLTDFELR